MTTPNQTEITQYSSASDPLQINGQVQKSGAHCGCCKSKLGIGSPVYTYTERALSYREASYAGSWTIRRYRCRACVARWNRGDYNGFNGNEVKKISQAEIEQFAAL